MTRSMQPLAQVSGIVVHHKRHQTIGEVVQGLLAGGIDPSRLVLVDNSESPDLQADLRRAVPAPVGIVVVANRGYGAAVNDGLTALRDRGIESEFTVVATHEIAVAGDCIERLIAALRDDASLFATGPILHSHSPAPGVWSAGGYLSPMLRTPKHATTLPGTEADAVLPCVWLDGALVAYRTEALPQRPFDESFFLYMEEVDLHMRLGYAGGRVAVVTSAHAAQESDGTPAFYFARNLRLLHSRHSPVLVNVVGTMIPWLKRAARVTMQRRWGELGALWKGLTARLPQADSRVIVVNPLGSALRHYTHEVRQVLLASGASTDVLSVLEPSASDGGRAAWLVHYIRALFISRRLSNSMEKSIVIVTWPVLGLWDAILLRAVVGRAVLVVHDPVPLVRAIGYGRVAMSVARLLAGRVTLLTHSREARNLLATATRLGTGRIVDCPHPVLTQAFEPSDSSESAIAVLGQYKTTRATDLLVAIAGQSDPSWVLRIVGRGWPHIPGWSVESRFVPEEDFRSRIRQASVVLIPYTRFYQSGVAIRSIELGTPVVGPRAALQDVLGSESKWLADESVSSWMTAIRAALDASHEDIHEVQRSLIDRAIAGWKPIALAIQTGRADE